MKLPDEDNPRIQKILNSDVTLERKSYQIEAIYKSKIPYNRNRQGRQEEPLLNHHQIRMELKKRGDNLTPIDIEL